MKPTKTEIDGPHNCEGCALFEDYECTNAIHWHGGTPENPPCFEYSPDYLAAAARCVNLANARGLDDPETLRAMAQSRELAPPHVIRMMEREAAAMDQADAAKEQPSDECRAAMATYRGFMERGEDDSPEARRAFMLAYELAPEWFKDEACSMVQDMGLIPKETYCNEAGEPVYRLEDVAECLGASIEETEEKLFEMLADREALGLPNDGIGGKATIHRMQ